MEVIGPLLTVALFVAFMGFVVGVNHRRTQRRLAAFDELSRRRSATLDPPRFLSTFPRMTFPAAGTTLVLTYHSTGGKHPVYSTELRAENLALPVFHAYNETGLSQLGKSLGLQDVEVGDHEFDPAFMVKGTDEAVVRRLLGPGVRRALLRFQAAGHPQVALRSDGARVLLRQRGLRETAPELEAFLAVAVPVYEALATCRREPV
jgi:hypothetical protein